MADNRAMTRPAWHTPPDARARAWVERAVAPGARVVRAWRLAGGIATAADALRIVVPGEAAPREVVLRRWLRPGWVDEEPALTPSHEAAILGAVASSSATAAGLLPVPRVLAVDPGGADAGAPSLLTDRLPGTRATPATEATAAVLEGCGSVLARVHALGGDPVAGPRLRAILPAFAPYYALVPRRIPARTHRAGLWARAHEICDLGPRPGPDVVLHRDLHPGNTLWTGTRLAGVVDWTGACLGPPGADLGHLRANLGPRHGIGAADRALAAYAGRAGSEPQDQPWWDVRMALDGFDAPDALTAAELDRIEAYLDEVVQRG
jgi:aminoglycoside phosphotransferase (APT) family kinase protein